ncbi:hypothetical protein [Bacillus thuringiensis]|uniref:hypothetical protein n=1 Tax=Bacillus thuringiensis TaxID=1428 RepID=UPI0030181863
MYDDKFINDNGKTVSGSAALMHAISEAGGPENYLLDKYAKQIDEGIILPMRIKEVLDVYERVSKKNVKIFDLNSPYISDKEFYRLVLEDLNYSYLDEGKLINSSVIGVW